MQFPFTKADTISVSGLRGSAASWFCAANQIDRPACCILPDEQMVGGFEQDLSLFTDRLIFTYPGYEIPPYTPLSPDQHTAASRLSTLYHLMESQDPFILIISIEALLRRVMSRVSLQKHAELLM
ncbi:MAG: transcription-repair coupling factor, partial [Deltaproteobacteria bacterium]